MAQGTRLRLFSAAALTKVLALAAVLILVVPSGGRASAIGGFDPAQVLTLGNEYVVLGVTKTGPEAGRFALETTGGAPDRPGDDGKPLIYGRPRPWTSYTTVRVDGQDFVFGGASETRAGRGGKYGTVTQEPEIRDGAVETTCRLGDLEVRQVLELAESSTSGLPDTVRIVYEVTNRGRSSHRLGMRVMLDTMLGQNDGAPIRLGERTLTGDSEAAGKDLPSFWQAFDSLTHPSVMAQGTVADATTVRPDRIEVSNWGNLADRLWTVPLVAGRPFVREGEDELDSAVALFWEEVPLGPGESRLYATAYGLGGVTIIPGELTLGLTAPATAGEAADGTGSFPVVAYVQNVGKWPARGVKVALRLPQGLTVRAGETTERQLGELSPGAEKTFLWQVKFRGLAGTVQKFRVEASANGLSPVVGERRVSIQGPPQLTVEGRPLPEVLVSGDGYSPEQVTVEARVGNSGPAGAKLVRAAVELPAGWTLARLEKTGKFLGNLEPGESRVVRWVIRPDGRGTREGLLKVRAMAVNAKAAWAELHSAAVPPLSPRLYLTTAADALRPGRLFRVEVRIANVAAAEGVVLEIGFDPGKLVVVGVSRGEAGVAPDGTLRPFSVAGIDNVRGVVGPVKAQVNSGTEGGTTVLTLHLLATTPGEVRLELRQAEVYSADQTQRVELVPLVLQIGREG